jgi:hypothetical protein
MWCHMVHIDGSPGIGFYPLVLGKTLTSVGDATLALRSGLRCQHLRTVDSLSNQRNADTHAGTNVWGPYFIRHKR